MIVKNSNAADSASYTTHSQPVFFVNYLDGQDRRAIGRHAQLVTHRRRRARGLARAAAHQRTAITATGPLAWRAAPSNAIALVSPQSGLGEGRKDPFSSYPIPASPEVDSLVDHLATTIGPQMCGYLPNPHFEFMRDRSLKLAIRDAAGFHTVLSMASSHKAAMNGMAPGQEALYHRVEAIRLVNRYLADPVLATSDRTIFAVAMLMAQERIWSTDTVVEAIGKGLDSILQQRGGIASLKRSAKLEFALYTIVLSAPILSPHGALAIYGLENARASREQVSLALTEEFVSFVDSVRSLALRPRSPYESLSFAFRFGTPSHRLLAAAPMPRAGWSGGWAMQERNRLATLLHVHCMVLDMDVSAELSAQYARHFQMIQRLEKIWENSLEMLHHLVVKHETEVRLDNSDRSWKVLRIVNTALKLGRDSYLAIRSFLFNCLSNDITTETWHLNIHLHPDQIREELLYEFSRPEYQSSTTLQNAISVDK